MQTQSFRGWDVEAREQMNVTATMDVEELTRDLASFWRFHRLGVTTLDVEPLVDFLTFVSGDGCEALKVLRRAGRVDLWNMDWQPQVVRLFDPHEVF